MPETSKNAFLISTISSVITKVKSKFSSACWPEGRTALSLWINVVVVRVSSAAFACPEKLKSKQKNNPPKIRANKKEQLRRVIISNNKFHIHQRCFRKSSAKLKMNR